MRHSAASTAPATAAAAGGAGAGAGTTGTAAAVIALAIDTVMVAAFVIIGRSAHHAGGELAGLASTAWPFLTGMAVGEAVTFPARRPLAVVPAGVGIWLSTVALGMALRVIAGQGTNLAFIGVALAFLGLFLLGWRLVAAAARYSRKGRNSSPKMT